MQNDKRGSTFRNDAAIKWLTCLMFMMFAMTSDAVGSVIPRLIKDYGLSLTAAGTFHYVPMAAIALGAIMLGFMADRFGRQVTIIIGLLFYGVSSALFAIGNDFAYFVTLLAVSGLGVSIFKTGALALVGDITKSANEHSSLMNTVEGFFATGAIIGPAIVATLLATGFSWKWLYVCAAVVCALLVTVSLTVHYPKKTTAEAPASLGRTLKMGRDPYALAFSTMIMLYVAVEVAIYVWMPTYLADYHGSLAWLPVYALTIFFVLRAVGRFLGAWLIRFVPWTWLLAVFSAADLCLLRRCAGRWNFGRRLSAAGDGPVHVGDLSDPQLEGNQLLQENRTRHRGRLDPVLHRRIRRRRTACHGGRQRRFRRRSVRLLAGDRICFLAVCGAPGEPHLQPRQATPGGTGDNQRRSLTALFAQ